MKRFAMRAFVMVFGCLMCLAACRADEAAAVTGLVTDPTGRSVPGVKIAITNLGTNVEAVTTTNDQGIYRVPALQPGVYRITLLKDGFKSIVKSGIELHVQDVASINFELQIGSVSETVTVTAGGININTTDAAVSTVVDRQFVENMPLNGRSFQSLLTLAPGVALVGNLGNGGASTASYGGEITVNGQRTEANYFTVDGVSGNTGAFAGNFTGAGFAGGVPTATASGSTQSLVSIDGLQEFRASTSTYSAEYGRTPGGQFSFSTRSGNNDWHGSVYDYLRNDVLDANNWFNNNLGLPREAERQNDFGGTLGGPLILPTLYNGKGKTFFFFSYEALRLLEPQALLVRLVPDMNLRQSSPAPLQPVLNAFPLPNGGEDGLNDGLALYNQALSFPSHLDAVSLRIDHSFGDKLKVFGRFSNATSDKVSYFLPSKDRYSNSVRALTLGLTALVTTRQSNSLRFNVTQNNASDDFESSNLGGARPLDIGSIPGPAGSGFPSPSEGGFLSICLCYGRGAQLQLAKTPNTQRQYNVTDKHTRTLGTHNMTFGIDWRRLATILTPISIEESLSYFSQASILGNSANFAFSSSQSVARPEPVYTNFSAFAQDEWRATRRLVISLGIRWDINPPPHSAMGPSPYTVTQISNLATTEVAPAGTPLWNTTWNNFAPRLGFAYRLSQNASRETVIRSGFGMFYDMGNLGASSGYNGLGFASQVTFSNVSFPLTSAQLQVPPSSVAPPYNTNVYAFDPNLKLPYTLQWNASVEQALGGKQALTLSYVGSGGRRLLTPVLYYPGFGLGNSNFALFSSLSVTTNRASSSYNALQIQYQKTLSHGLQALASYTFSHSIDEASSNFQSLELLRASSDFDIRQNFQAALTYDVPGGYSSRVLSAILKHWAIDARISARSATPVDIVGQQNLDPTGAFLNFHPNLVSGQPLYVSGPQYPGGRLINYAAFTQPTTGGEGDVPRNFARGFAAVQADLALRRDFPIYERLRLQFRAEAFNVLNHPNFGTVDGSLSDGPNRFGYAQSSLNRSLGGLSSLYQNGGPRSLQLMLRLTF